LPQCDEHAYRAYVIGSENQITGPAVIISANDDGDAIEAVRRILATNPIELWDYNRLVLRLEPKETGIDRFGSDCRARA
jgi:hypothetical protein